MKCVIYRRVSTEMQREEGFSLEAQKSRLLSYIESQGWTLVEDYADEGVSAKNIERPALQRLIADMRLGKFEVVLVYRLDRLVRSVTDLHAMLQEFERNSVKFKSATEVFDTTSAMGRLFITMVGAMAQWERENLAERVTMGMQKKHEEGKRNGARAPFGYDIGEDGELIPNEAEAKWVRYIFEAFKTKGRKMIAQELNNNGVRTKLGALWNDFALHYIVTNPVYYGALRWNYRKTSGARTHEETVITASHVPLITKELYDEVQEVRTARKGSGFKSDTHYPFTGVIKCARCGKSFVGAKRKKKDGEYRFYRCRGRFTYGVCDMPIIPEEVIEEEMIREFPLQEIAKYAEPIEEETDVDVEALRKELERINSAEKRLKDMYKWGDLTEVEYRGDMAALKERRSLIEDNLRTDSASLALEEIKEAFDIISENWAEMSYEGRKNIIKELISSATIEVTGAVKGGPGNRPNIKITDYQWR
ncbi:recombinase family protein [Bacillus idriensis]|uniref:Recombinase family protein n=1 Tax=Metabacillus idriensis TaxID=324768 RepID=A0A6I2MFQ7_9BACI|nr:recombinase family protein [Metabacillus idriensis]MRX54633.1 recombinase family protein [Metabacillus idriensis]